MNLARRETLALRIRLLFTPPEPRSGLCQTTVVEKLCGSADARVRYRPQDEKHHLFARLLHVRSNQITQNPSRSRTHRKTTYAARIHYSSLFISHSAGRYDSSLSGTICFSSAYGALCRLSLCKMSASSWISNGALKLKKIS